jgi:hypothetical protein
MNDIEFLKASAPTLYVMLLQNSAAWLYLAAIYSVSVH